MLGCAVAGGHGPDACPLLEVMATGEPMPYHETAIRAPMAGSIRVAGGYSAVARSGPTGAGAEPAHSGAQATAIVRDISAVRALEELREGFVATVSHELRTPLSLIRGYAETLLHLDLEPAEQRAYLERIDEVTGRLSALVGQILDVTHLQADPLILERAPVLFAALVTRLRGDLETSGRADRLVVDLPADLPPIEVDAARVGQILENLVENAFKYGPPDGGSSRSRPRSMGSGWPSRSTTRGSGSRPRNGRSSRNPSTAPGTSANRGSRGPGSGCTSAGDWWRPTVAGSGWRTGRTAGPARASCSRCRC